MPWTCFDEEHPGVSWDGEQLTRSVTLQYPDADCVLFYRGLDCNLVYSDGCVSETAGRSLLEEKVFPDLPFSGYMSYGPHTPVVRLGVYPIVYNGKTLP